MPACYTNTLSVRPGERFGLHASASAGPCALEIARVGQDRRVVLRKDGVAVGDHPTPEHADRDGCGWPVALEVQVGADWISGYYDIVLTDAAGEAAHHFVCVKPPLGAPGARAALVLSTNTYHAYNHWGGANAYCDVAALMSRRAKLPEAMAGAIGVLSTRRPFPQLMIAPPADAPRLINLRRREFRERPFAGDPAWQRAHRSSPYDGSAGFLNKWEHAFAAWAEAEGVALDYFTDRDLDIEPGLLEPYAALILVGHSEYWTATGRDAVEAFVDGGGNLAVFSGNTCFWKVRFEDEGGRFICHKWNGFEADPAAAEDPMLGTHLWSHRAFGRPEAAMTGLTFLFGGYHRLGACVARGQAGFTVYDERHWALQGADLFYGDVIGADLPFVGYENDGCRFQFGDDGRLKPTAELGVPANLEIIAIAPCAFGEAEVEGYPPLIPPERLDLIARDVFGQAGAAAEDRILRGHAVMASFRRGAGEVFNGGTTEWAHGLKAGDPFVTQ
ncbi:MAG TPA: N,N-dimethylformamidase beta subunit family domain-containing protein, partial [Caulobacteraceae bacterium]|nr:N,N-dimethylformamidase beta subunit family domain-containing protein [Caulobacteraceae bacterium]